MTGRDTAPSSPQLSLQVNIIAKVGSRRILRAALSDPRDVETMSSQWCVGSRSHAKKRFLGLERHCVQYCLTLPSCPEGVFERKLIFPVIIMCEFIEEFRDK